MRRAALLLSLVAITTLAGMTVASAAVAGTVSIAYNATTMHFHGKVRSADPECRVGRAVKVFKVTSAGRTLQGKTLSVAKGVWKVDVMHASGKYIAVSPKQKIMSTTCARAVSPIVDVM
ncbi:MAG TPA: hypothetical protein VLX89_01570 [Actinomycetota bacterium]|nr:hypothetical protein [Actinomycetota bacterium]